MKASRLSFSVLSAVAADGPKQSIEKLDPALDALIASDAKIDPVSNGGYTWSEGPVWYKGRIVFSDVPNNVAYQWIEGDAVASVFLKPSGTDEPFTNQGSNGLAVDGQGRILLCRPAHDTYAWRRRQIRAARDEEP
jgi:gluconolactonase